MAKHEYQVWRVSLALTRDYDLGLKVRYRDQQELPSWEEGPSLSDAFAQAEADRWSVFDQEPGDGHGVQRIYHLVRDASRGEMYATSQGHHPAA